MITIKPRQTSGIRSGQRRDWMPAQHSNVFLLACQERAEIVRFIPQGSQVEVMRTSLSLTGCWSEHTAGTIQYTLPIEVARKVYARLTQAGYKSR